MNLWRVRIEEESGMVLGQPEAVTTPSPNAGCISITRDGRRLAYVNRLETSDIYKVDFDPVREAAVGQPSPITRGSWQAGSPAVSPDGNSLVFHVYGKREDLYVIRTDGAALRQLTDDEHEDRSPSWSPDGKRIAFQSNRGGGPPQIWVMNADGSGLQQLTRHQGVNVNRPVWSPDGSKLAYSGFDRDSSAFLMNLSKPWQEGTVEILPRPDRRNCWLMVSSWSPDGRQLAGTLRGPTTECVGISVYSFDSRRHEQFTEFGWFPRWLSDSRRLVFTTFATTSESALYLLETRSKRVREILSVTPDEIRGAAPSPDGRRIYLGISSPEADVWLMEVKRP